MINTYHLKSLNPQFYIYIAQFVTRNALYIITLLVLDTLQLKAQTNLYEKFNAGAATVKITPPVGSIMGNSYGITISKGIHDDLYAKVLVFEVDGIQAAFIALDLISIPHEVVMRTRELVAKDVNIPGTNIIMTATHAHAGPQMNPLFWDAIGGLPKQKSQEYVKILPEVIAKGVQMAKDRLQPVYVSAGNVKEQAINFNRRFLMKDGTFKTNPGRQNPQSVRAVGPIDPDLNVVYFESLNFEPVALLVNFALHPAIVEGDQFSADFPGIVSTLLAKVKGEEMVTVYTNGNSGNINHIDVATEHQLGSYEESTRIATIIAADVLKALSNLRPIPINSLQVLSKTVELPTPIVQQDEFKWAQQVMGQFGKSESPSFSDVVKAWRILDLVDPEGGEKARHQITTTVPLIKGGGALISEVQVMALGRELTLVGFPGDAFVELGLAIKINSPFPITIVNEQSGNGTISYVPNRKAFLEGGYEVISARYSPGGGELLVDAVNSLLIEIYPY